jgi:hypothetical protein
MLFANHSQRPDSFRKLFNRAVSAASCTRIYWLKKYRNAAPWATDENLKALIGPNWKP